MKVLRYDILSGFNGLMHFTTTRKGGVSTGAYASMNLSPYSGDTPANVAANRKLLAGYLNIPAAHFIIPYQTHEDKVTIIPSDYPSYSTGEKEKFLHGTDALITNFPDFCIGVTTADCTPILLFDSRKRVIAAVHAGWRSTVKHIAEKTVEKMKACFGSSSDDIYAAIGPCIGIEAFEVGKEVYDAFEQTGFPMEKISFLNPGSGKFHIDLAKANEWMLTKSGIKVNHIETSGVCTYSCPEDFFSARKSGIRSGRLLTGIMLND